MSEKQKVKRKRGKMFPLMLSEDEHIELKTRATKTGFTMSTYAIAMIFRNGVLETATRDIGDNRELVIAVRDMLYEINKIGNNINQIARKCNTIGTANKDDVAPVLGEVKALNEKFMEAFGELLYGDS